MKRVLLFVLLSSVALAAAAQDQTSSVTVRGSQIQLPERAYPMFGSELGQYKGAYYLSNGEKMIVRQDGRRLTAEVGNRPAKQMVAISPNEFVALDSQLKVRFEGDAFDMSTELWMSVPRTISGIGGSDVVRLVSLR